MKSLRKVAYVFVLLAVGMGQAQIGGDVLKVKIPFNFSVGTQTFSSGEYSLKPLLPNTMLLRDQAGQVFGQKSLHSIRAGQGQLFRMVAGETAPDAGAVTVGGSVKMGYFAQHAMELLDPQKTVWDTLQDAFPRASVGSLRSLAGCFGFSGDDVEKPSRVPGPVRVRHRQPAGAAVTRSGTTEAPGRTRCTIPQILSPGDPFPSHDRAPRSPPPCFRLELLAARPS